MKILPVFRKPLEGTTVDNLKKHGCGALNIRATRLETPDKLGGGSEKSCTFEDKEGWSRPWMSDPESRKKYFERVGEKIEEAESFGRYPTNLLLKHHIACEKNERPVGFIEGLENVEYHCHPSCIVKRIESQSLFCSRYFKQFETKDG